MSATDPEIDPRAFRKRVGTAPSVSKSREFRCSECNARCTVLLDGQTEAGHQRHCSRSLERTGAERQRPIAMSDGRGQTAVAMVVLLAILALLLGIAVAVVVVG